MVPALCAPTGAVPPPSYQRALAKQPSALHVTALAPFQTQHIWCPIIFKTSTPRMPVSSPQKIRRLCEHNQS